MSTGMLRHLTNCRFIIIRLLLFWLLLTRQLFCSNYRLGQDPTDESAGIIAVAGLYRQHSHFVISLRAAENTK